MTTSSRHFIFGYGSLINSISRQVTGETGAAVAVKISGFVRHWSKISSHYGMSSVVVLADISGACNGVLVEVQGSELKQFDEREKGYQRVLVDLHSINFYDSSQILLAGPGSDIKIWLYQAETIVQPCQKFPVVFSYLDVILAGCLEYSSEFCDDFIELTQGWQHRMLNDRQNPRYPRVQEDLDTALLDPFIERKSRLHKQQIMLGYSS